MSLDGSRFQVLCSRFLVKLSQRNGDVGEGRLEVYHAEMGKFMPACVSHWELTSPQEVCAMLGYT